MAISYLYFERVVNAFCIRISSKWFSTTPNSDNILHFLRPALLRLGPRRAVIILAELDHRLRTEGLDVCTACLNV